MKSKDITFIFGILVIASPVFFLSDMVDFYKTLNQQYGMVMSFMKFAVLATLGEVIGLRIKTGNYNQPGFGIPARAVVWGLLGLTIQMAFIIFSTGAPQFLAYLGMKDAPALLSQPGLSAAKVLVAFTVSVTMNLIYAPVMMTLHKITDTHIEMQQGRLSALYTPIPMGRIMADINWKVQWNFVFKKTIPFFWIPAHTITFLLPADYRVLFAALLGIMLGVLLAVAAISGRKKI